MAIACPYCHNQLNLKTPQPGSYRPRCPSCIRTFTVVVPVGKQKTLVLAETKRLLDPVAAVAPNDPRVNLTVDGTLANTNPAPGGPYGRANRGVGNRANPDEGLLPKTEISGYRIERELGRGGMGTVYLAHQLSLDRPVALKVMSKRWANDPVFVARFTREAFAAAQLRHPNIVQIHDIGEVDGSRFFSMEYVPGQSLAELIRRNGKVDPETAVGYILQAARGLKHAHERGMIHRDVKPDNLILDDQGLIKLADLGLVKTPNMSQQDDALVAGPAEVATSAASRVTEPQIALGTPAYMSPEQCRDAAAVDHRADIYSLGCTLYVLLTGRPPYDGNTAVELMTKQTYEPLVPPDRLVARLPKELSALLEKMMAKNPDDRYANAGELIRSLEAWLGVRTAGTFTPSHEQIDRLEEFATRYHDSPTAVLRSRVLTGFTGAVALAIVLLLFYGKPTWAFGVIGLGLEFAVAYFLINGLGCKGEVFTRVRQLVFGLGLADWAVAVAGVALFAILLGVLGVFWHWLGFGLLGLAFALVVHFTIDRKVEEERRAAVDGCEKLLRRLRAKGLDEEDLRGFVAKFSGRHWEALFEGLFGYDAKLVARAALLPAGSAGPRERFAVWREPLIAFIDRIEQAREEAHVRRLLAAVEQARIEASGAPTREAANKARLAAEAMVREAEKIRQAEVDRVRIRSTSQATFTTPAQVASLARGSSNPEFTFDTPSEHKNVVVGLVAGSVVRLLLASMLLAGFCLWVYQNGSITGSQPLQFEGVALQATGWIDSINVGIAGVLLMISLCYRGNRMGTLVILGAVIAVFGPRTGIRAVEPLQSGQIALMLGGLLAFIGIRSDTH